MFNSLEPERVQQLTSKQAATTTGSQAARDIGVLVAAFRAIDEPNSGTTWTCRRVYQTFIIGSFLAGPSPLQAAWTDLEETFSGSTPLFSLTEINTSPDSPLSPTACPASVALFNGAVGRISAYEHYTDDPNAQKVIPSLTQHKTRIGTLMIAAFGLSRTTIAAVYSKTCATDIVATWVELEQSYTPTFSLSAAMTAPESPFVTGDWTVAENDKALGRAVEAENTRRA